MAEQDRVSKDTSVETNWGKLGIVVIILLILAGLVTVAGPDLWNWLTKEYRLRQSPQFAFTFSGVPQQSQPIYEVTFDMSYTHKLFGHFEISVSADYRGSGYDEPVAIMIRPATGDPKLLGRWESFRDEHAKPQTFTLTNESLFEYSNVPYIPSVVSLADGVTDTLSKGTFDIEVIAQDGTQLARQAVEVINTPWSHAAQLSDSLISASQTITAYVTVRNIGMPAEFYVVGNLYDATSVPTGTLEQGQDGWSPAKSWGQPLSIFSEASPNIVDTGTKFTVKFPIASGRLQERHTYVLETFALKHLPELEFSTGDWRTAPESWRIRDNPTYMLIVVPAGME